MLILGLCVLAVSAATTPSAVLKASTMPSRPLPEGCLVKEGLWSSEGYISAFPEDPLLGLCSAASFTLDAHIGTGKYGKVYRATHTSTGIIVAIKQIRFTNAAMAVDIRREECTQHMMEHPAIRKHYCTYYNKAESTFNLVLEYVEGKPMEAVLKELGRIPLDMLRPWSATLVEAIHTMHLHGLTFCDLKPENVLVSPDNNLKIIDFGLARPSRSCTFGQAFPSGSPLFWPPEHFPVDPNKCYSDPSMDWWSLGIMHIFLWINKQPYDLKSIDIYKGNVQLYISEFGRLVQMGPQLDPIYNEESPELVDFIQKLTVVGRAARVGVDEATVYNQLLDHPWLKLQQ